MRGQQRADLRDFRVAPVYRQQRSQGDCSGCAPRRLRPGSPQALRGSLRRKRELITATRNRRDCVTPEHLAKRGDLRLHVVFLDEHTRPDPLHQFLLGHQLATALHQDEQHVEGPRSKRNRITVLQQQAFVGQQLEPVEADALPIHRCANEVSGVPADSTHQVREMPVGAQAVEYRFGVELDEIGITALVGSLQPVEGVRAVVAGGIDLGDVVRYT